MIELMTSVSIVAIIAAAAIPHDLTYVRRSKSVEAAMNVRKIGLYIALDVE